MIFNKIRTLTPEKLLVLIRLMVFLGVCLLAISSDAGERISPLSFQNHTTDMGFYLEWADNYFDWSEENLNWVVQSYHEVLRLENSDFVIPGPIFPAMIKLLNYSPGTTLPLALVFLGISICYGLWWVKWMKRQDGPKWAIWAFAVIPNPLWFTLVLSTDILFSLFFLAFFMNYVEKEEEAGDKKASFWLACCIMCRPNALSLLAFCVIDRVFLRPKRTDTTTIVIFILICIVSGVLYLPYFVFMYHLSDASEMLTYFGHSSAQHARGLYSELPEVLDKTLSLIRLIVGKFLYFFGLRPSYSDTPFILVAIRGAVGIFMLPGLYLYLKKSALHKKIFIGTFIAPIMLGASQDRYNLPILPLLFFFGTMWYASLLTKTNPIKT